MALAQSYRYVEHWGMAGGATTRVLCPRSVMELRASFAEARASGTPLTLRGAGNSYGDASTGSQGFVIDCTRFNRILAFDAATGIAELEPGVTLRELWRHTLPQGWWPRVVSGTSFTTIGGIAAANIHGKNNFAVGTVGDAILEFDLLDAQGNLHTCSRERESELFHAAIGAFGLLGAFTRIRLQTKHVYSGELEVTTFAGKNLRELMDFVLAHVDDADYLVGWIDCFAASDALGRGQIHHGRYLHEDEDHDAEETLRVAHQELSPMVFGVVPKSELWRATRLLNHDAGMRFINGVRYWQGRLEGLLPPKRWTHVEFSFLLDSVPNWKWSYGRRPGHGLIQFQPFVPKESAHAVFSEILRRSQARGFVPYLGVLKRHRPDPFWLTHAVDGWSLALDYKVTPATREALFAFCRSLAELVLDAGGRFYFAKDSILPADALERMLPRERLDAFFELKSALDPAGLLETDLWRRVAPERLEGARETRAQEVRE
ncbi:MAG: FAD-binding oxidoreductase [Planctomycetes bacterium]|nr:FAD-binding oxidoreductase [Planctomycetota bacterium]